VSALGSSSSPATHQIVVVTTSYPEHLGDAQGHFVAAEVRRLCDTARVTVLAPGRGRSTLFGERVVSLGGGAAFGFPGALERLRRAPFRALSATAFVTRAIAWLRRSAPPEQLIAHFLLPCGLPLATRGVAHAPETELEIVVHGSDARLFAGLPAGQRWLGAELLRCRARLRFVSTELQALVLGALPPSQRRLVARRSRVEPCALDVSAAPSRQQARALLKLDQGDKIAVIVARLVPGKRVDVALAACRRLPNLQTIVVGDGPERERLAQRFPEARFVGHVERPLALSYLAAADALVSASLNEGAPSIVREARALGTPVVCLAAGDLRQWAETDVGIHVVGGSA
jgi:teichuronic acid biosynthesis glycosyltransferase TuaC